MSIRAPAMTVPPLTKTLMQGAGLYARLYFEFLPLILLFALAYHGLNYFLPARDDLSLLFFIRMLFAMAFSAFFFSLTILPIISASTGQPISISQGLVGIKRFFPVFGAYFLVSLPIIITLLTVRYFIIHLQPGMILALIIISIFVSLLLASYLFLAGPLIVVKQQNIRHACNNSIRAIRGNTVDTFLLLLVMSLLGVALSLVLDNNFYVISQALQDFITTLISSIFYPIMIAVRFVQLQQTAAELL